MNTPKLGSPWKSLPVGADLTLAYGATLVIAALLVAGSGVGLLFSDQVYPTETLRRMTISNDAINLIVVLPALLVSLMGARSGRLLGLLFWPGALLAVTYNAVAYVFALPLNAAFLLALGQMVLSLYVVVGLIAAVDVVRLERRIRDGVPERVSASVLVVLGAAFLLLALGTMIQGALGLVETPAELGVFLADSLIAPAWVVGGVLLWRGRPLGYLAGGALLFQASVLFVGVIGFTLLQPLMTDAPFVLADTLVLIGMGLVCFIPTVLFARGVVDRENG